MPDEVTVYALDGSDNKHVTYTATQIIELVQQALATGTIPSELSAFIEELKEQNKGGSIKFWKGTQAEFLALDEIHDDWVYLLTDSTSLKSLDEAIVELENGLLDGSFDIKKAETADTAETAVNSQKVNDLELKYDENGVLKIGDVIIPQKKLLWSGNCTFSGTEQEIVLDEDLDGLTIEIEWTHSGTRKRVSRLKIYREEGDQYSYCSGTAIATNESQYLGSASDSSAEKRQMTIDVLNINLFGVGNTTIQFAGICRVQVEQEVHNSTPEEVTTKIYREQTSCTITKIYKIIE